MAYEVWSGRVLAHGIRAMLHPKQLLPSSGIGPFVTVRYASDLLHVHPRTVRRWIESGQLSALRTSILKGRLLIPRDALEEFLSERRVPSRGPENHEPSGDREGFTPRQLASQLGWPLPRVMAAIHAGELPSRRVGGEWVISKDALDEFFRRAEARP